MFIIKYSILLVDDEVDLLDIFSEFLIDDGYIVKTSTNGLDALKLMKKEKFDLIVSDINMPGMKGFELLEYVANLYPQMKRILITAYDVRDYLNHAKNYGVSNIITKTVPFNFNEIRLLIDNILTGNIFGLERYIDGKIVECTIRENRDIEKSIIEIVNWLDSKNHKRRFKQALGEMVVNAFFYGGRNEAGDKKEQWNFSAKLPEDMAVHISYARDAEKCGVSIVDQSGRLTKKKVLYWLERNTTKGDNGISIGLTDNHGKGLFITRETVDRLIINIEPQKRTEIIILNFNDGLYDGYRPLWIQEV